MMKMSYRDKFVVYHNTSSDTWTNDSKEQMSIHYDGRRFMPFGSKAKCSNSQYDILSSYEKDLPDKVSKVIDMAYDVAVRKFRRRQSKERQNAKLESVIEKCLGIDISLKGGLLGALNLPVRTCIDEMYDDGIDDKHYGSSVVDDYTDDILSVVKNGDKDDVTRSQEALSYL